MKYIPMSKTFGIPGSEIRIRINQDADGDLNVRFMKDLSESSHLLANYCADDIASLGFPVKPNIANDIESGELVEVAF